MEKRSEVDWPTVAKLMGGGAVLGAGVGTASSLIRYLTALNERAKKRQKNLQDDDVLYLNLPAKQAAEGNNAATFAVGGLGSLLGAYLAYDLVRGVHNKLRRKQLQKELDQAQNAYVGGLTALGPEKQASQFSGVTKLVGSGYLAGLLTMLGSAIVANKMLEKQFPVRKPDKAVQPRKIVVRTIRPDGEEKEMPSESDMVTADGVEGLIRQNLAQEKSASAWGLTDLVAHVASGHGGEFKRLVSEHGVDAALDMIKGASRDDMDTVRANMAVSWIANDPVVSSAVQPFLAAQFHQDSPTLFKAGRAILNEMEPEDVHDLVGVAELVAKSARHAAFAKVAARLPAVLIKRADALRINPLTENVLLANALSQMLEKPKDEPRSMLTVAPESVSPTDKAKKPERKAKKQRALMAVEDEDAEKFVGENKDIIDEVLAAS